MLAELKLPIPIEPVGKLPGLLFSDVLILVGIGLAIAIALILWAIFIRKPKDLNTRTGPARTEPVQAVSKRKRRKRRRREHRSRNPSLADTGGLPTPRVEGTTPES